MYPFKVECLVYTRPNLRSDANEMSMYIGRNHLVDLFDLMQVKPDVTIVTLFYPERWLNLFELSQLYQRCEKYYPNLELLRITTHSVAIIQETPPESLSIMDVDVREAIGRRSSLSDILYGKGSGAPIDPSVITVLSKG
jgi:hypothetical protein